MNRCLPLLIAIILCGCGPKADVTPLKRALVELQGVVSDNSVVTLPSSWMRNKVAGAVGRVQVEYGVYEKVLSPEAKAIYLRIDSICVTLVYSIYTGTHGDNGEGDAALELGRTRCRDAVDSLKPLLSDLIQTL